MYKFFIFLTFFKFLVPYCCASATPKILPKTLYKQGPFQVFKLDPIWAEKRFPGHQSLLDPSIEEARENDSFIDLILRFDDEIGKNIRPEEGNLYKTFYGISARSEYFYICCDTQIISKCSLSMFGDTQYLPKARFYMTDNFSLFFSLQSEFSTQFHFQLTLSWVCSQLAESVNQHNTFWDSPVSVGIPQEYSPIPPLMNTNIQNDPFSNHLQTWIQVDVDNWGHLEQCAHEKSMCIGVKCKDTASYLFELKKYVFLTRDSYSAPNGLSEGNQTSFCENNTEGSLIDRLIFLAYFSSSLTSSHAQQVLSHLSKTLILFDPKCDQVYLQINDLLAYDVLLASEILKGLHSEASYLKAMSFAIAQGLLTTLRATQPVYQG